MCAMHRAVALVFLALAFASCGAAAPYRAGVVGYEVQSPPAFSSATSHDEFRMERTAVGVPLDIATTHFGASRDFLLGGAAEAYVVIGLRGPFSLARDEATLAALEAGFSERLSGMGLTMSDRRPLATSASAIGEELSYVPVKDATIHRRLGVRILAGARAAYFVIAAVDDDDANANVFAERRAAFFEGFRVTPAPGAEDPGAAPLEEEKMKALGRVVGVVVTSRGAE